MHSDNLDADSHGSSRQARRRVLFIGDGGTSTQLQELLAASNVDVTFLVRRIPVSLSPLARHLRYVGLAFDLIRLRRGYDKIFIWQQFVGIYYSLLSKFLRSDRKPYLVYYIIGKPRRGLKGIFFVYLYRALFRDPYVSRVYFLTESDYLYDLVDREKRSLHNNMFVFSEFLDRNYNKYFVGNYIFSGGTNNRKFEDIAQMASARQTMRFVVACRPEDFSVRLGDSINLQVRHDAYGEDFEKLLSSCRIAVIPIRHPDVMSGQLVVLKALQAGKAIIISNNNFLQSWIPDYEELPFIFTYSRVEDALLILDSLDDAELLRLGAAARVYYEENVSEQAFVRRFAEDILSPPWPV